MNQPSVGDLAIWQEIRGHSHDWHYKGLIGRLQVAGHRLIGRWARVYRDQVVVDIGCGRGAHLQHSGNQYGRYVGVDEDVDCLIELRKRYPGTPVVVGDAGALPFVSGATECVISVYCLEHVRGLGAALAEMERVLRPGGALLVGLPAEGGLAVRLGRRLVSRRYFERRYGVDWLALVAWEHCNHFAEVVSMLSKRFAVEARRLIPFAFAPWQLNAIGCVRGRKHA